MCTEPTMKIIYLVFLVFRFGRSQMMRNYIFVHRAIPPFSSTSNMVSHFSTGKDNFTLLAKVSNIKFWRNLMVEALITRSQTNEQIWPPLKFIFYFVKNASNSNAEYSMQQNILLKSEWL
jgi:hypothetical protein